MKLYYAPGACSLSALISLIEAGQKFDLEKVDLRSKKTGSGKDFTTINPKGQVPTLQLEDGSPLTEVAAVLQYIADLAPQTKLAPANGSLERYRLQEWLNFIGTELHKSFGPLFNPSYPDAAKEINRAQIGKRFDRLSQQLQSGFLMGEQFTVADAYLFVMLNWTAHTGIDLSKWPVLQAYQGRVAARPHVQEALKAEGLGRSVVSPGARTSLPGSGLPRCEPGRGVPPRARPPLSWSPLVKSLPLLALVLTAGLGGSSPALAATSGPPALQGLDGLYPELDALYRDLHQHPELSRQEEKTAAKLAERLRPLGFEVTPKVGGTGVVAVLRNGAGPTLLLRTDLDALPVQEKTGLPYASQVTTQDDTGQSVPVMHACGHDVHMTAWLGTATLLSRARASWHGTLVMVGQPAEERGSGARGMLADGLYTRFPKPDFALAIHNSATAASGSIEYVSGYALANVDSVDITLHGKGGHGAYPQTTVDPIVMAARTVLALQTIVSREKSPLEPAVITVGSIHGGTKHNIIPDDVKLQLTVRSYKPEVRKQLLAAITRVVNAEAELSGAPRKPDIAVLDDTTPATYNDPALTQRLVGAVSRVLGEQNVRETTPVMGGEDFAEYGLAGVPAVMLWVGTVAPSRLAEAKASGESLPSLHSALFAPDREKTIRTAVTTLTTCALELLGKP